MELIRYSLMPEALDEAGLVSPVAEFVKENSRRNYLELRTPLLEFCINECVHPSEFAAVFAGLRGPKKRQVQQLVTNIEFDTPLMCVCMGCQASILNS